MNAWFLDSELSTCFHNVCASSPRELIGYSHEMNPQNYSKFLNQVHTSRKPVRAWNYFDLYISMCVCVHPRGH